MQAIVQNTYGSPDALSLVEVERPTLGEHDVLVQVFASPVTQGDRRLRAGDFPGISWLPGRMMMGFTGPRSPIPGTMFAGRVAAVGSAVTRFDVGDDVFGGVDNGALGELVAVAEDGRVAPMPAGLTHEEAATLPYGAVTALYFLRDVLAVQPGEHVAILGASGGVGRMAVQIAKHLGARVTGVASAASHDLVRSLGADHVVDYRTQDFRETGHRYDVILDTLGASRFDRARTALTATGRYASLIVSARLVFHALTTALFGGPRAYAGVALGTRQYIEDVAALVAQGALRPVVGRVFPLREAAAAHAHLEADRPHASVVVTVSERPAVERLAVVTG